MKCCSCGNSCKCEGCKCGQYAEVFETLGNHNRMLILETLKGGPRNVSQIVEETGLEQTCVSHCLGKLERLRFVFAKRNGKFRVYTINKASIEPMLRLIDKHISEVKL